MSALLTTTMPNMGKTIEAFIDADLRDKVKIMVGGAPVTQEFADDMGADGYGKDAMACVDAGQAAAVRGRLECHEPRSIPPRYQKRLDRMSEIFSTMIAHASTTCPASAALTRTGSTSAPRNSAAATSASRAIPASCACVRGDDKLDYRSAWESA